MRKLLGLIGLSLICFAVIAYFKGFVNGIYSGIFVIGGGLFLDSLKK